ncbi:RnfH family protein [Rhodanobacter sp. Col0626]|uniref:RnfH family protein n=1 Tax=Rhodanobacter sp. Col0626 TaxID=3415679 RepID=UPI003CF74BAC
MVDPITVEVVYADHGQQILKRIALAAGSTVAQAVDASGIPQMLAAGSIDPDRLGIYGHKAAPAQLVQSGDRIEIYRPLALDPMEARRRRAR